jgi:ABC-type methionine transport system ATPase subunit
MILTGQAKRERARELLDMVGLSNRRKSKLSQLSGGEQQRVAIAIGLANNPKLLLADEPTGSVDTKTTRQIMEVFREFNRAYGVTVVIVTHDRQISRMVDRVVAIRDGRTSSEFIRRRYADEIAEMKKLGTTDEPMDEETHEELAVLDRSGRLQIPREYLEALGLKEKNKIKVELDGERIILRPPDEVSSSWKED